MLPRPVGRLQVSWIKVIAGGSFAGSWRRPNPGSTLIFARFLFATAVHLAPMLFPQAVDVTVLQKFHGAVIFDLDFRIRSMEEMKMQGDAKAPGETLNPLSLQRGCAAVIASMAWFGLGVQLYFNIAEALAKNLPMTAHLITFFSYFTIEINCLVAVVVTIFWAQPQAKRFLTGPSFNAALVVYIIVVGVVYELLLRHLWHPHGMQLLADVLLHDAVPLFYSLFWLLLLPKGVLRWPDPVTWLIYPLLFFFYSMLRGAALGTYTYPFIDASQLGLARVSVNATVLLAVFFGLGAAVTALDHALGSNSRERSGLGRAAEL